MRTRVLLAVVLLIRFGATAQAAPDTIIFDNFNDNSLNTSLWMAAFGGGGGTITEVGQQLEVVALPFGGEGTGAGVLLLETIIGNFDVQVHYSLPGPLPVEEGANVGILLGTPSLGAGIGVGRETVWDSPSLCGGSYQGQSYVAAFGASSQFRVCNSDNSGMLRFIRLDGFMSAWYYGTSDWVLIAASDDPNFEPITTLALAAQNAGLGTMPFGNSVS